MSTHNEDPVTDEKLMSMTASDFRSQSMSFCETQHEILKNKFFVEIDRLSKIGERSLDTNNFIHHDRDLYHFIKGCDRLGMREFFEKKGFNVSEWHDKCTHPIIRW